MMLRLDPMGWLGVPRRPFSVIVSVSTLGKVYTCAGGPFCDQVKIETRDGNRPNELSKTPWAIVTH